MMPLGLVVLNRSVNISRNSCRFEHGCLCGNIGLRKYGNTENWFRKYATRELWSRCEQQVRLRDQLIWIDIYLTTSSDNSARSIDVIIMIMSLKQSTLRLDSIWKNGNAEIQKFGNTEIQKYKNMRIQICWNSGFSVDDLVISTPSELHQSLSDTSSWLKNQTLTGIRISINPEIWKYRNTEIRKYGNMRICKCSSGLVSHTCQSNWTNFHLKFNASDRLSTAKRWTSTDTEMRKYANTEIWKYGNIKIQEYGWMEQWDNRTSMDNLFLQTLDQVASTFSDHSNSWSGWTCEAIYGIREYGNAKIWKYKNTEIQEYENTDLLEFRVFGWWLEHQHSVRVASTSILRHSLEYEYK